MTLIVMAAHTGSLSEGRILKTSCRDHAAKTDFHEAVSLAGFFLWQPAIYIRGSSAPSL